MNTRNCDVQELNADSQSSLANDFQIEIVELRLSEADAEGTDAVFFRSTTTCTCTC